MSQWRQTIVYRNAQALTDESPALRTEQNESDIPIVNGTVTKFQMAIDQRTGWDITRHVFIGEIE